MTFATVGEYFGKQFSLLQTAEFFLRIIIAGICGATIGIERTRRYKEAGIRTHVIVCAAAALIMIVSKYGFVDMSLPGGNYSGTDGADPARIAAQVVSGISFLCAGVIFKNGSTVKGLTTAAGLWATAGIGLAIGTGFYWLGLFVTVMIALLQIAMHRFAIGADATFTNSLRLRVINGDVFYKTLREKLKEWQAEAVNTRVSRGEDGVTLFELTLRMPRELGAEELLRFSAEHDEVLEISNSPRG
ncbi:MAG: MgtC/SapB family protein [Oscillospiraceae bacterium]|nr:MgtC/SapB family protein [Oscillospiraceae bacterium]